MIKFEIPFKLPSLNEYVKECRGNKYSGAKFKADVEDSILWVLSPIKSVIDKPVHINFEWHEKTKRRDKDNVAFAKKFILDALQKSKILPNDNNHFVLGFTDKFIYDKADKCVVTISDE